MSRSRSDLNGKIFSRLQKLVDEDQLGRIKNGRRHIIADANDKNWIKDLSIKQKVKFSTDLATSLLSFDGNEYFLVVGRENSGLIPDEILSLIQTNAGVFIVAAGELDIPLAKNLPNISNELLNSVYIQVDDDDGDSAESLPNWAYEWSDISKYYQPLTLFCIPSDSLLYGQKSLSKITGYFLTKNKDQLILPFSGETLALFEKIFLEDGDYIPHENLLLCLLASNWKYAFLDTYRNIEGLFHVHALRNFHKDINANISLLDFSEKLDGELGWRPKEDKTLSKIIEDENTPETAKKLLREVKRYLDGDSEGQLGEKFYKIRNSIVHYRPSFKKIEMDDQHWDKLIRASLIVTKYWYSVFKNDFDQI